VFLFPPSQLPLPSDAERSSPDSETYSLEFFSPVRQIPPSTIQIQVECALAPIKVPVYRDIRSAASTAPGSHCIGARSHRSPSSKCVFKPQLVNKRRMLTF